MAGLGFPQPVLAINIAGLAAELVYIWPELCGVRDKAMLGHR
jgi:hypothetical protein